MAERIAEVEVLKGQLCHCQDRSPKIAGGSGSVEEPFTLEYTDEDESTEASSYMMPPVEEVAALVCDCLEAVAIEGDDKDEVMATGMLRCRFLDWLGTNTMHTESSDGESAVGEEENALPVQVEAPPPYIVRRKMAVG